MKDDDEDKNLGRWVNRQRSQYQAGKLRKDRQLALEKIGLKWSMLATTSWESMFDTLCEYVEERTKDGEEWDGNVPANYKTTDNPPRALGRWINRQRSAFGKDKLKPEYVAKLNEIGLKWSVHERRPAYQLTPSRPDGAVSNTDIPDPVTSNLTGTKQASHTANSPGATKPASSAQTKASNVTDATSTNKTKVGLLTTPSAASATKDVKALDSAAPANPAALGNPYPLAGTPVQKPPTTPSSVSKPLQTKTPSGGKQLSVAAVKQVSVEKQEATEPPAKPAAATTSTTINGPNPSPAASDSINEAPAIAQAPTTIERDAIGKTEGTKQGEQAIPVQSGPPKPSADASQVTKTEPTTVTASKNATISESHTAAENEATPKSTDTAIAQETSQSSITVDTK